MLSPGTMHDLALALPYEVVAPKQNWIASNHPIPTIRQMMWLSGNIIKNHILKYKI